MKTVTYDETKFKLVPVEAAIECPHRWAAAGGGWRHCMECGQKQVLVSDEWRVVASPVAERPPAQQQQPQTDEKQVRGESFPSRDSHPAKGGVK